jgi:hypothetical protein
MQGKVGIFRKDKTLAQYTTRRGIFAKQKNKIAP